MIRIALVDTDLGEFGLAVSDTGLRAVALPGPDLRQRLLSGCGTGNFVEDAACLTNLAQRLRAYCRGEVVSFDDLFSKIMLGVGRDPRITDLSKKSLRAYAEEVYRTMCKQIGQSGMVGQSIDALRGLEVFVVVKELRDMDTGIEVYADEGQAVGTLNNWLKSMDVNVTAQQMRLWEEKPPETRGPSPLFATKALGSGVLKCVIR